jgi:hypothetical protein
MARLVRLDSWFEGSRRFAMAPRARREVERGPSEWRVEGRLGHTSVGKIGNAQGAKGPQVVVKDPQRMEIILRSLFNCQVCTLFLV